MRSNSIDRVVVSNTNPHNNNALWIDTSNGEKNAVLKYKGNPLVGGSGGGSDGSGSLNLELFGFIEEMTEEEKQIVQNNSSTVYYYNYKIKENCIYYINRDDNEVFYYTGASIDENNNIIYIKLSNGYDYGIPSSDSIYNGLPSGWLYCSTGD